MDVIVLMTRNALLGIATKQLLNVHQHAVKIRPMVLTAMAATAQQLTPAQNVHQLTALNNKLANQNAMKLRASAATPMAATVHSHTNVDQECAPTTSVFHPVQVNTRLVLTLTTVSALLPLTAQHQVSVPLVSAQTISACQAAMQHQLLENTQMDATVHLTMSASIEIVQITNASSHSPGGHI
jgi:hypothetical protein